MKQDQVLLHNEIGKSRSDSGERESVLDSGQQLMMEQMKAMVLSSSFFWNKLSLAFLDHLMAPLALESEYPILQLLHVENLKCQNLLLHWKFPPQCCSHGKMVEK